MMHYHSTRLLERIDSNPCQVRVTSTSVGHCGRTQGSPVRGGQWCGELDGLLQKEDERTMPALLADPVAHLISLLDGSAQRVLIGMAGLPGSGKSTLAASLARQVNLRVASTSMIALGMDGFHLTKADLARMPNPEQAIARRGAPWTFDPAALHDRLKQLRNQAGRAEVAWPGFQHDIGDPIEGAERVPASVRLVLIEGIYLLHDDVDWLPINGLLDERWYLDTPPAIAMERLVQRHMRARGHSRAAAQHRIDTSDGLNAAIIAPGRERADWLLEGT